MCSLLRRWDSRGCHGVLGCTSSVGGGHASGHELIEARDQHVPGSGGGDYWDHDPSAASTRHLRPRPKEGL